MTNHPVVSLAAILPKHHDALFSQYSHPESVHMAAFVHGDPSDRRAFGTRMARLAADPAILCRTIITGGEAVGMVASFEMEGEREITYGVHPDLWNRGIATEALRLFLREENRRPLRARSASDNAGSLRVLEKNGFRRCGSERHYAPARREEIEETLLVLD